MSTVTFKNLSYPDFATQLTPALNQFLQDHEAFLAGKSINKEQAVRDMYSLVHGKYALYYQSPSATISSSCVTAMITCAIDVVSIVLQAVGVPESVTKAVAVEIVDDISPEALTGLEAAFKALADADSLTDKAKAIFALFAGFYKITGIRQILGAIEHNMAWYEWVLMGTVITAQLTAWLATDGIAAIAEIVILGALVAQAVADATLVVSACNIG
ncbi:hypothetical protein GFS24_05110 [Chitinophaga sp. SYP-B3965]|uniref:hypothetical protein n=1 Tax=Chitinophaga sp. SYP-B3965 TaxID=2663120 RepID=UPI001299A395|nr:hypothetical protein [Chitinophaga sp. SYP-B3965]MRG44479.1 hypothetical protein [Chitinophaga sp. SYP-B3965]